MKRLTVAFLVVAFSQICAQAQELGLDRKSVVTLVQKVRDGGAEFICDAKAVSSALKLSPVNKAPLRGIGTVHTLGRRDGTRQGEVQIFPAACSVSVTVEAGAICDLHRGGWDAEVGARSVPAPPPIHGPENAPPSQPTFFHYFPSRKEGWNDEVQLVLPVSGNCVERVVAFAYRRLVEAPIVPQR